MNGEASNDVFISYRREVGGILAMALHQHLTERGLDVFYDIESLRAGQFDTAILNQIAARPYFLLVLTPGTLDRCREPTTGSAARSSRPLATNRVIVPANTPGFDFDDLERFLPEGIGPEVRRFNAQELPQRWFKFAVQQLVEEFLVPIELENLAPPADDQDVVDRLHEQARTAPPVTDAQLSAHEYFEQAWARGDDDLDGKIADYCRGDPPSILSMRWHSTTGASPARAQGDLEGAIADYDEAISPRPCGRGRVQQPRQCARAIRVISRGPLQTTRRRSASNPENARAFNNRGVARLDQGDSGGSYRGLRRVDPSRPASMRWRSTTVAPPGTPRVIMRGRSRITTSRSVSIPSTRSRSTTGLGPALPG